MASDKPVFKGDELHAFSIELEARTDLEFPVKKKRWEGRGVHGGIPQRIIQVQARRQSMLEIVGRNGILRLDLGRTELHYLMMKEV